MDDNVKIKDEEKDNYTFFNKDSFQKRFKNLLAFVCLMRTLKNDDDDDICVKEIDYSYLFEKYEKYISLSDITEEEKQKVILFASSLKKISPPDVLISKWNEAFGEEAFYNISIEPNYRRGLHVLLKKNLFDVYMNNLFKDCKTYKTWRKYKIAKLLK